MNGLSWPAKIYVAILTLVVGALSVGVLRSAEVPGSGRVVLAAACGGLMAVAWLYPLPLSFKRKLFLDTSVLVAVIALFEPGGAMLIAGGGTLVAHALRRADWVEATFNTSQMMLQAALGAAILGILGRGTGGDLPREPMSFALIVIAGAVMFVVNHLAVAIMVSAQSGMSPIHVWFQAARGADRVEYLGHLAQVGLGSAAAILTMDAPWSLPLLLLPAIVVYWLLDRNIRLRCRAETALQERDGALAEAQRVARVGSWTWDLTTGEQSWSEEVFRILDLPAAAFQPTWEAFKQVIHPADRVSVDVTIHDALYAGTSFDIDHRVLLPDGGLRMVHLRGEVVLDQGGRKARLVGTVQDITARKTLEARLAHQAFRDPLTALPNRALLFESLARALGSEEAWRKAVAVMLVNLGNLKAINRTFGQETGDAALIELTRRITACLAPQDLVARFDDDELVLLLESTLAEKPESVAERMLRLIHAPIRVNGHAVTVEANIGIAGRGQTLRTPTDLLRAAATACSRARVGNHAAWVMFDPGLHTERAARSERGAALATALQQGELELYYQPEVELATGRIVGLEALARWRRSDDTWVLPADFIPSAEETGQILPFGRWALTEACRACRLWQTPVGQAQPLTVSVNVSVRQLRDPDFARQVNRILRETGLEAGRLRLELTERALAEDADFTDRVLRALRDLGVGLILDDLGTGYSSLDLRRLPIDALKLDRSLVDGLDAGEADRSIVQALVSLAHDFGVTITAEGIERPEQLAWASAVGCDRGQGYFFAPPLSSRQLAHLLAGVVPFEVALTRKRAAATPVPTGTRWADGARIEAAAAATVVPLRVR